MDSSVRAFIEKNQLLKKGSTVLVGVSGGPDSMALLHFLQRFSNVWNIRVIAATADHQLRGNESREDVAYVRRVCHAWGIELAEGTLDVAAYKEMENLGTQVASRHLRYAFFEKEMDRFQADYLALGHHGDDQAETMLMGLVHSANVTSLKGIPMQRAFAKGHIVRPLLCVTKEEIERYCREWSIIPRRDPSNSENTYTRNYYRNLVLPLLKEKNSNLHRTIQHLSESIQDDEAFLTTKAEQMFKEIVVVSEEEKAVSFSVSAFYNYSRSLQRRFIHLILNYMYDDYPKKLSYVHEEQLFAMMKESSGNIQLHFPQKLKVERNYETMLFHFRDEHVLTYDFLLDVPGEVELPNGWRVTANYTNCPETEGKKVYTCYRASVALPLHIRTRQAGDRMRWNGLNGSKKIKDIFIDAKVPLNERDTWPVVTDNNGNVLWLAGLKKGLPPKQTEDGPFIQLSYERKQ
ncbi:tRNA lysidine(34) synthetase TilS [Lentibacillus cibarius]|uniref:tRNA(Ile)-lysidine synthase n=1 Tax=Lentibacillus cibarius TaxID=2583219 RepID=A0A549YGW7_9BACI|nr:tRNA lysidine(34) synthetase TilS [Lentibacillus cibarius]TRM11129.1 tRNA lysidine(34) synthetase TilS [Lentibacillus cibarius]